MYCFLFPRNHSLLCYIFQKLLFYFFVKTLQKVFVFCWTLQSEGERESKIEWKCKLSNVEYKLVSNEIEINRMKKKKKLNLIKKCQIRWKYS